MIPACTRARLAALSVVLAMAAISCGGSATPDGDGGLRLTAVPSEERSPATTGSPSSTGTTSDGATPASETPTADGSASSGDGAGGSDGGGTELTPITDTGRVGVNGPAYLRGDRPRVVVEIDVQEGAGIDDAAVAHLRQTIAQVSDAAEVVLAGGNSFASDRDRWTSADLRAAADANRSVFSDDTTAAIHLLVVEGGFEKDGEMTSAIGLAYSSSQMAVFPDRWSDLTGALLGSSAQVARAVLVHELGHLLGLVNLTYTSEIDHEDAEHPGHSSNQGSAMYWAIETTAIGQVFSGPPPDTFDDADLADLEGLRTGRYTP